MSIAETASGAALRARGLAIFLTVCAACNSTSGPGSPKATATIGPQGGQLSTFGVELNVPSGALVTPTEITVTVDSNDSPVGYLAVTPVYRFSPSGLTFARPATVAFATGRSAPRGRGYWSRGMGSGYEDVHTTWVGGTAVATVSHFSTGFVGEVAGDSGFPEDATLPNDAAAVDATVSDANEPDAQLGTDADAGVTPVADAAGDGSAPDDSGTPDDAGVTIAYSVVTFVNSGYAGPQNTTDTIVVTVDAYVPEPDSDGGCTGRTSVGHYGVTVPAIDLPYLVRAPFKSVPASTCGAPKYDVAATEVTVGGISIAFGTNECDVGIPLPGCQVIVRLQDAGIADAAIADAGSPDAPPLVGLDASVEFTGTVTGTVPVGASYIAVVLQYSGKGMSSNPPPICNPGPPTGGQKLPLYLPPTLPATYSIVWNPIASACYVRFEVQAFGTSADLSAMPLPNSSVGTQSCGDIGSPAFTALSPITSTHVTCDVSIP